MYHLKNASSGRALICSLPFVTNRRHKANSRHKANRIYKGVLEFHMNYKQLSVWTKQQMRFTM